ncbi:MAG: fasciclin domain-containing protein [Candidatus Krumholzibacteriia bacterium]
MRNLITALVLTVAVALAVPALVAQAGGYADKTTPQAAKAIVPLAEDAGFTTLVAAVKAAGLVEALSAAGPYTVFAPTDEAFAKLPEGTVEALLANPEQLKKVLLYHVVAGNVMAADVVKLTSAKTLGGQSVAIDAQDGVKVNDANIIKTDIAASNGVVHVIDTVLIPKNL